MSAKPTLYLETSVASYLTARPSRDVVILAQQQLTHEWWHERSALYSIHISPVVLDEASRGDAEAAQRRLSMIAGFPVLPLMESAVELAGIYIREGVLPESASVDALHLSLACQHRMDYLVTWNCRHIASGHVRRRLQEINEKLATWMPIICTPAELMGDDR